MNTIKYALFFYLLFLSAPSTSAIHNTKDHKEHSPLEFVGDIHQRYYLIRRLEGSVNLLIRAYNLQITKKTGFKSEELRQFSDPIVQDCMQTIGKSGTIEAFHKVWEFFLSYRFIDKPDFSRETVLLLLILYNQILATITPRSPAMQQLWERGHACVKERAPDNTRNTTKELALIQEISGVLQGKTGKHQPELLKLLTQHHTLDDVSPAMSSYNVQDSYDSLVNIVEAEKVGDFVINNNVRFYHIQRLLRSIFVLSRYRYSLRPMGSLCTCFSHDRVRRCAQAIERTKSIEPLFKLWKHFVSYDFIEDDLLLTEFIQLIVCVYQHIEIEAHGERFAFVFNTSIDGKAAIETALHLYETMHDLPISELLDILDEVVDQFESFSSTYELYNNELSWCAWLKRYWWAMPTFVGKIALIVIKHAKALGLVKGDSASVA